jgi:hypothetical protein
MIIIQNLYEYLHPVTHTQTRNEPSLFLLRLTASLQFPILSFLFFCEARGKGLVILLYLL